MPNQAVLPVFDKPIVQSRLVIVAVSHHQHGVCAECTATCRLQVHATAVLLEGRLPGIYGYGDGSLNGHCLLQGLLIVLGEILVTVTYPTTAGLVIMALAILETLSQMVLIK